ncbi:kinase-like domain-containing protein [Mycena capillaripes]|nr:kinase-like domain-containing protein [Mycena capillaripes]
MFRSMQQQELRNVPSYFPEHSPMQEIGRPISPLSVNRRSKRISSSSDDSDSSWRWSVTAVVGIRPTQSTPEPEWDNMQQGPWSEIHRRFATCVLRALRIYDAPLNELSQLTKQWAEWDNLTSLANYRSVVKILFEYLKSLQLKPPRSIRVFAIEVSDRLSDDISSIDKKIYSVLSESATYKQFLSCRGTVAQQLLDLLQDLLDSSYELRSRPLISKALLRLSGACGLHPTCFTLSGLEKIGQQVAGGAFGDIWKGLIGGQTVAVKSMRQFKEDDVRMSLKKFGREALIWRQLSHPNLLPFFGLYMLDDRLCLISPWMDNGDLKHFLSNSSSGIDRVSLIVDVAMGLEYLHSKSVVHGDLKAANILVTPSGRACITDFGLSSIVDELSLKLTFSSHSGRAGTLRYQAPELLSNECSNHFGSDVYAFACVCYEILTGKVPFFEISNEAAIVYKVTVERARPSKLEVISSGLWILLEDCWHRKTDQRPTMTATLQRLTRQPIRAKVKQSLPDWDETYSAKFRRSLQEWPLLPSIPDIQRRLPCNTIDVDSALEPGLPRLGTVDLRGENWDTSRFIYWSGPPREDEIREHDRSSAPMMNHVPVPPQAPSVNNATLPAIHPWLDGDIPAPVFNFDFAPIAFVPWHRIASNPPQSTSVDQAEFHRPAFHPPLHALRIVHPGIPFWAVHLTVPPEATSISFGDVLVGLHRAMHKLITKSDWELLDEEVARAVTSAFTARCSAEATRQSHNGGSLKQLRDREIAIRNEGVKCVDFLQGKTLFKGLVWACTDLPACMSLVTA